MNMMQPESQTKMRKGSAINLFTILTLLCTYTQLGAQVLNNQCSPAPSGLVGWWPAEGSALDSFGVNNGVVVNGATYAQGVVGQAFNLDGTNDYIRVADTPQLHLGSAFSYELWFYQRTAEVGNGYRLLDKTTAGLLDGYIFD